MNYYRVPVFGVLECYASSLSGVTIKKQHSFKSCRAFRFAGFSCKLLVLLGHWFYNFKKRRGFDEKEVRFVYCHHLYIGHG